MRRNKSVCAGIVLACLAWFSSAAAGNGDVLPSMPDREEAAQFQDVPEPWRDYLVAVRSADSIADPLERCIAFPDLPDSNWPEGHSQAHCRYHFETAIGLDEVEALLLAGNVEELDTLVTGYQQRHGASEGHSAIIHSFWDQFDEEREQAARIADAWLAAGPTSPWANLAKGIVLAGTGSYARGGRYARETPQENFRRMRSLFDQALPYLQNVIEAEPTAMDAYRWMLVIARIDSRDELEHWAFSQGHSVDPGCSTFAIARMDSLAPRWGGSAEAMLAYAESLRPHVAHRPMLANALAFPFADTASGLIRNKTYNQHAADLSAVAVRTSSHENALRRAAQVAVYRNDGGTVDLWRGTAIYLQLARFEPLNAYARRIVGLQLLPHEPEWALAELIEAHRLSPGVAHDRMLLAAAYRMNKMPDDAERHFLEVVADERYRREALGNVAVMWLTESALPGPEAAMRAAPHIDLMLRDDPNDARARLLRIEQHQRATGVVERADIEAFLAVADHDDPELSEAIRFFSRFLAPGPRSD